MLIKPVCCLINSKVYVGGGAVLFVCFMDPDLRLDLHQFPSAAQLTFDPSSSSSSRPSLKLRGESAPVPECQGKVPL